MVVATPLRQTSWNAYLGIYMLESVCHIQYMEVFLHSTIVRYKYFLINVLSRLFFLKSFNFVNNTSFYREIVHQKVFQKFLKVKMSWILSSFSLTELPRYKIPLLVGWTSFKWLLIMIRLGYHVKIWPNFCKKSPKDP